MSEEKKELSEAPPSRKTDGRYAVLMETSGEESESWYYFIRIQGNEDALKKLQKQLEHVEWYVIDDLTTFDLELERNVSAQTAKEMTKLELNHCSWHRKFDGVLKDIDFDFKKKDGNETKICKVFDVLGLGQIEDYISDEDIDEEDMLTSSETESEDESGDEKKDEKKDDKRGETKKIGRIPAALNNGKNK